MKHYEIIRTVRGEVNYKQLFQLITVESTEVYDGVSQCYLIGSDENLDLRANQWFDELSKRNGTYRDMFGQPHQGTIVNTTMFLIENEKSTRVK